MSAPSLLFALFKESDELFEPEESRFDLCELLELVELSDPLGVFLDPELLRLLRLLRLLVLLSSFDAVFLIQALSGRVLTLGTVLLVLSDEAALEENERERAWDLGAFCIVFPEDLGAVEAAGAFEAVCLGCEVRERSELVEAFLSLESLPVESLPPRRKESRMEARFNGLCRLNLKSGMAIISTSSPSSDVSPPC
mmetsp:Transcript_12625/g.22495  ORF Transcript_12625/g.22495 Transcript_12625/m.22495 type:complete len:196 (+) Transcript_12625:2193-2780(+)